MSGRVLGQQAARFVALFTGTVLAAALVNVSAARAAPTPPPNPTTNQINKAKAAKNALAAQAGQLTARVVVLQNQIQQLDGAARLAEQQLALARQKQQQAKDSAAAAKARVVQARVKVGQARTQFTGYLQAAYMSGQVSGTTGVLLTADNPSALMEQVALQQYSASHQIDAIGQLESANVGKSNAEAAARGALARQTQATAEARLAQQNVLSALAQAKNQKTTLNNQLAVERESLKQAQIKLTGLADQRAAYKAWRREQARIAAERAARLRAQQLAQQRAAAANAARQAAAVAANSGGNDSGGGGGGSPAPAPSGGGWTAAKGQQAVNRVMGYVGMPYSFAAGNASGPTLGVCEPGDAFNDCHVFGFDCSGLTLYAWAPWLSTDHFAATQYGQVGSYHPSVNNLMPGDLVFWSGDGTVGGIGHDAMYIGNGNVIQAPQSGDVIKITNIYNVESGYFGATRPLT